MSYVDMAHAKWVERNIAAVKKNRKPTAAERRRAADGEGWFAAPDKLSPDQARMFNILGIVGGGIYNAPILWDTVRWHCWTGIGVVWRGNLCTFDFDRLTMLVFLCHEARIRCEVSPHGRGYLMIMLHPRVATGGMAQRHPNLSEAVAAFRRAVPADHSTFYIEAAPELAEAETATA
jgi:hypothetical protein